MQLTDAVLLKMTPVIHHIKVSTRHYLAMLLIFPLRPVR